MAAPVGPKKLGGNDFERLHRPSACSSSRCDAQRTAYLAPRTLLIQQDAKDAVVPTVIDAAGGPLIPSWLLLKVIWFSIVSAAIVITFYKVGSWIASW